MGKIKNFIWTSILGGLIVILPAAIILMVFVWIYRSASSMVEPLTLLIVQRSSLGEAIVSFLVILALVSLCFALGVLVKTRFGAGIFYLLESRILKVAPGYTLVKETIMQFFGKKKSPFSSVGLVRLFGNETLMTAFVTEEHSNGMATVFVPTGPNPTSGNIFHVPKEAITLVDVPIDTTMRSILGCGSGSHPLLEKYKKINS